MDSNSEAAEGGAVTQESIQTAARLVFGNGGNAVPHQVSGFSWPEDGHTWALGPSATLRVNLRPGIGDLMLEISVRPFMIPPYLVRQRVGLSVDGVELGCEWAEDDTVLGYRIPGSRIGGRTEIKLVFSFPDAVSPADRLFNSDTRQLACQMREAMLVWIPPQVPFPPRCLSPLPLADADPPARAAELVRFCTGLTVPDLMTYFESLGWNCEFGLVQRICGAEPMGLLRFVSIPANRLLEGLDFGFEDIDDPHLVHAYPSDGRPKEWLLRHDRYHMHAHTFVPIETTGEATILSQQIKRLRLQRRRLLEVLDTGQNLFVVQLQQHMTEAHALPILTMLRSYGPNALLFVTPNADEPPGSVDQLGPHLFRGNIDRLAPIGDARDLHLSAWISICANAYRLWRQAGHGID